jgi:hypothetical protein
MTNNTESKEIEELTLLLLLLLTSWTEKVTGVELRRA